MNRRLFFSFPCYVLTAGALFLFNRNLAEAAKGAPRRRRGEGCCYTMAPPLRPSILDATIDQHPPSGHFCHRVVTKLASGLADALLIPAASHHRRDTFPTHPCIIATTHWDFSRGSLYISDPMICIYKSLYIIIIIPRYYRGFFPVKKDI